MNRKLSKYAPTRYRAFSGFTKQIFANFAKLVVNLLASEAAELEHTHASGTD